MDTIIQRKDKKIEVKNNHTKKDHLRKKETSREENEKGAEKWEGSRGPTASILQKNLSQEARRGPKVKYE